MIGESYDNTLTQVVKVALQDAIHHEEPRIRFITLVHCNHEHDQHKNHDDHGHHCQYLHHDDDQDADSSARTPFYCSQS